MLLSNSKKKKKKERGGEWGLSTIYMRDNIYFVNCIVLQSNFSNHFFLIENKPVESWSGVQSSNEENTVEAKTASSKSSQGTIDDKGNTKTIEGKPDNNEATK